MTTIPVRRGSLTISTCDTELGRIALRLPGKIGRNRARILGDADRWLDIRLELAEERERIKQNHRALG